MPLASASTCTSFVNTTTWNRPVAPLSTSSPLSEMASVKKGPVMRQYGRKGGAEGWHFLTGDKASVDALTKAGVLLNEDDSDDDDGGIHKALAKLGVRTLHGTALSDGDEDEESGDGD